LLGPHRLELALELPQLAGVIQAHDAFADDSDRLLAALGVSV
jgi:hypothetical protein